MGKSHVHPHLSNGFERATRIAEGFHTDFRGPFSVPTPQGELYLLRGIGSAYWRATSTKLRWPCRRWSFHNSSWSPLPPPYERAKREVGVNSVRASCRKNNWVLGSRSPTKTRPLTLLLPTQSSLTLAFFSSLFASYSAAQSSSVKSNTFLCVAAQHASDRRAFQMLNWSAVLSTVWQRAPSGAWAWLLELITCERFSQQNFNKGPVKDSVSKI